MTVSLSRIDRVEYEYDVTVHLPDGSPGSVSALDFAVVPWRTGVDAGTAWQTFPVSSGAAVVTFAAPDATDLTGALLPPLGVGDLWLREVDGSLTRAIRADTVVVD